MDFSWAPCRNCSSKQPEDFTMAVLSIHSFAVPTAKLPFPPHVFAGTDPPGCTELSKWGSTDTLHLGSRHRAVLPVEGRRQVQMSVTPSAPGTFCTAVLPCWVSPTQGTLSPTRLGQLRDGAKGWDKPNRGGTSYTSQALLPFSEQKTFKQAT